MFDINAYTTKNKKSRAIIIKYIIEGYMLYNDENYF